MAWNPFGVMLEISASAGTVTRTSATQFTVKITAAWETYYSGAKTIYGMTASSGGSSINLNSFGTNSAGKSGSFTGTYSISGNAAATKTIAVTFRNFNDDNGDSATKTINLSVSVPAWTSYTVKYNANGGTGAPSSQTKWKDQTLKLSTTKPTRTGYSFQGWATSASGSVAYASGANYTANAAVTLYAVWKANTYTVSYNANGGTGAPGNQTKTYGTTLTLSTTKPTRTNYNFLGWGTSASATTVAYAAGGSYTANAAITLYAIWELAYTKPRITNFTVKRCDSAGTAQDDGTYALVGFSWATDKTVSSVKIEWKLATATSYESRTTVGATGTSGTISQVVGLGLLEAMSTYTMKVTVSDTVDASTKEKTLNSLAFTIHGRPGGNGVAFGKTAEEDGCADFAYFTRHRGKACFANNMPIYGTDPNDSTVSREALNPCNANGNVVIGYGMYSAKSGNTNIYGNDVLIGVANTANPGAYKPYRSRGDTITITYRSAGYVTNSGKDVSFWIPMSAPIVGSPTLTASSNNGFVLRQGNAYTHGSAADVYVHPTSYEVTGTAFSGIYIKAVFSDTSNVTNNDAIGIYWSGKIELT